MIGKRIRKVRGGLNQTEFAESLGIERSSLSLIETGKRNPGKRTVASICKIYGINETWLREGVGEMYEEKALSLDELCNRAEATDLERRLLAGYLALPKEVREQVLEWIRASFGVDSEKGDTEEEDIPVEETDTTAAAEAAYQKALDIAPPTESSASSTTEDIPKPDLSDSAAS